MSAIEWIEGRSYEADRAHRLAEEWLDDFGVWLNGSPDFSCYDAHAKTKDGYLLRIDGPADAIVIDVRIVDDADLRGESYVDTSYAESVTITRLPQ